MFTALAVRGAFRNGNDFEAYHRTGGWFLAGRDLYECPGLMPYRYLPGVAALFAPLSALSFPAARAVWSALNGALAFLAALWMSRRADGVAGTRGALAAAPLAWILLLQPFFQEVSHGQVDLLVMVLALAAFTAEDRGRGLTAGSLVALAAALKASPIVFAADWALRRRARPLVGVALGALLLGIAPVPTFGWMGAMKQHLHFLSLNSTDIQGRQGEPDNQSLWTMAHQVGLGFAGGAALSAALLAAILSTRDRERRRLLLLASVPLLSGYGWPAGFVVAVPLLAALLAEDRIVAWSAGAVAAAISTLSYDVAGRRAEVWAREHRVLGLLLLGLVLIGRASAVDRARGWARCPPGPGAPEHGPP